MIKNLINNKCYVGFHATNSEYENDNYFGSGKILSNAIKKYGINNFIKGILEYIDPNEWREKEKYWISKMNSYIRLGGYNITLGGNGILGYKHTLKSKEIISYHSIKNWENSNFRNKQIKRMSNIKFSEERCNNISKSLKGKPLSDSHKNIIGIKNKIILKGHTVSDETKQKIKNSLKGKPLSEERKQKISNTLKGNRLSKETRKR